VYSRLDQNHFSFGTLLNQTHSPLHVRPGSIALHPWSTLLNHASAFMAHMPLFSSRTGWNSQVGVNVGALDNAELLMTLNISGVRLGEDVELAVDRLLASGS